MVGLCSKMFSEMNSYKLSEKNISDFQLVWHAAVFSKIYHFNPMQFYILQALGARLVGDVQVEAAWET